ncbi:diacylglycerol kinase [Campylobacter hyointestinalis]|uniref:diacylglycerol kinase n=1 Tax=Campylobacter hyointestinalis TaxID=198 RepID=UPI00072ACACE|nr:diacylglycerol kinase [Campylobacter hyointestinalis]CUU83805.1 diacylglycerol kinase [Campylobacter hyointestinalis subsp. hyointestinalis]CUU85983.1 diacylglycerol kinase [Campylobacter hyointestinalis subsp. hyointestinalis]
MRNQPKYNFFKNSSYALQGLKDIYENEKSFKIELTIILPLLVVQVFLNLSLEGHLILVISLFGIIITECINSGIERCVDLACKEQNLLAKKAKDAGAAAVFLSIGVASLVWIIVILKLIF